MTVVHIVINLGGGGAQQMVYELSKTAKEKSDKAIVIALTDSAGLEYKFKSNDLEYHFLGLNSFKNIKPALNKLHDILKNEINLIFHCHLFHPYIIGFLYNFKYKKIPIVFTMHNNKVKELYRRLFLLITKSFRKKDIIFSENSKKWYLKNSAVIPNGIDFSALDYDVKRQYNQSETFNFLFLGRLSEEKNPLIMISLAEGLINNKITNFIIKVVGVGNMSDELIESISSHNLDKHFKIMGFQSIVKPILEDSHCLILPSLWEGMPIVLIEAAAAKLPVISTPVGSIPDFLNNQNAYLSSKEEFYKSMLQVMTNYNEALEKSEILYKEMKSAFNIESVYTKHKNLYKSVTKAK